MQFPRAHSGFTYIELMIVMLICVTLYAVALGPSEAAKRKREMAHCAENLRKLHLTAGLYAEEHGGAYPAVSGARRTRDVLRRLAPQYTTDATFLTCPVEGGGYSYAMGQRKDGPVSILAADRLASHLLSPGSLLFSKQGNHGEKSGNVLFTDGHVEALGSTAPRSLTPGPGVTMLNP